VSSVFPYPVRRNPAPFSLCEVRVQQAPAEVPTRVETMAYRDQPCRAATLSGSYVLAISSMAVRIAFWWQFSSRLS